MTYSFKHTHFSVVGIVRPSQVPFKRIDSSTKKLPRFTQLTETKDPAGLELNRSFQQSSGTERRARPLASDFLSSDLLASVCPIVTIPSF